MAQEEREQSATPVGRRRITVRHPEKIHKPDNPSVERPDWIRVRAPVKSGCREVSAKMRGCDLVTVCEEAACPNIGECWTQNHAAFMVMGDICTRACAFCNVATGKPQELDADEPRRIAETVAELGLSHVVITSVDRDDLPDGGARHFAALVRRVREMAPKTTIELLTPDFLRKPGALEILLADAPDVLNHNLECAPRLYPTIRPGARYGHSLKLLADAKKMAPNLFTKSGLMLGLGEELDEIAQVMDDMRAADIDFLTMGQYLQPTPKHASVKKYITPQEFRDLGRLAEEKGFLQVSSSPLTRSSYHADKDFELLKAKREAGLANKKARS